MHTGGDTFFSTEIISDKPENRCICENKITEETRKVTPFRHKYRNLTESDIISEEV